MKRQTRHINRVQLHVRVWDTPPAILSEEMGLSREALHNLCKEHGVPWPSEGYWRRKSAGLPTVKLRLPRHKRKASSNIVVGAVNKIRPHPVVEAFLERQMQLREQSPNADMTSTPCEGRRLSVMSQIFYGVEQSNIRPSIGKLNIIVFWFRDVMIGCRLREKLEKPDNVISDKQRSQLPRHIRHRDLLPTGRLAFEIDARCVDVGTKREWIEAPSRPIEKMLPEIVTAIGRALLFQVEIEKERTLRRESARADERARYAERDRQELEERRWLALVEIAERAQAVDRVRRLLAELEAGSFNSSHVGGDRTTEEWLIWAREQLDTRDPLRDGIAEVIEVISRIR